MAKVFEIVVSYGLTQGLPQYSNVKPSLTERVLVEEGDDPDEVYARYFAQVKERVEAAVDAVLEQWDQPAKYSAEPRYTIYKTYSSRFDTALPATVAVIPTGQAQLSSADWHTPHTGLRYEHALRVATRELSYYEGGAQLLDCSDGDLSRLPRREPAPSSPDPADFDDQDRYQGEEDTGL